MRRQPLLEVFVRGVASPSRLTWLGLHLRTDAFQAAFVWFFASAFPRPALNAVLARAMAVGTMGALIIGAGLVAFDTYRAACSRDTHWRAVVDGARLSALPANRHRQSLVLALQFLWMVPLLVIVPLKLRECGPNDRRRFIWLAVGIIAGFLPLIANVFLYSFSPAYAALVRERQYEAVLGVFILLALTAVPLAAAYAALVQKTLDVTLVIRAAMQYLLARSFILIVSLTPFVLLLVMVGLE